MHANKVHFDRCPVRIEIPDLLVHLRTRVADEARGGIPGPKALAMKATSLALTTAGRFEKAQNAANLGGRLLGSRTTLGRLPWPLSSWSNARDAPAPPKQTFRQWWCDSHDGGRP